MTDTHDIHQAYRAAFAGFEASLNGGAATPLHAHRRQALEHLLEDGLPTARDEAWKHTNPAALARTYYAPVETPGTVTAAQIEAFVAAGVDGPLLVFVDGHYADGLSRTAELPIGARVRRLTEAANDDGVDVTPHAMGESRTFAALSTAFVRDGAVVEVDDDVEVDVPVQILHVSTGATVDGTPGLTAPRVHVRAGARSRVRVCETFAAIHDTRDSGEAAGEGLVASVAEIAVGESAHVEHTRLHLHGDAQRHAGNVYVTEADSARFVQHTFCLSGRLVREDVHTRLAGEQIDSTLNGLYLPRGEEQVDNFTTIEHAAPNCSSHELYKGILGGKARGVFRGKIHVHQVAQQTDAYQSNQNLLMSDDAEVMSKPQLEIYADDVKCSHGSTTGELDESALFYLRARGIGLDTARRVLTRAFADELVDRVGHEGLRAHIEGFVAARLDAVLADDGEAA